MSQEEDKKKASLAKSSREKVIKPSRLSMRITIDKLSQDKQSAEQAAWAVWGLVSTWNPHWQRNQEMMDMVRELGQGDVFQGLTDLLTKKDRAVKLKALGALAQLPYFSRRNKAIMCGNERLLDRLLRLMRVDDAWSHQVQQLQMRACRVMASLCSTPAANTSVCKRLLDHPNFLDVVVRTATEGRGGAKHEAARIIYNLSYTAEGVRALNHAHVVERVLLNVLDGQVDGPEPALRTLWSILAAANLTGNDPSRQLLKHREIRVIVTALESAVLQAPLDIGGMSLQGQIDCVDVDQHDTGLRVYPFTALQPLSKLASCPDRTSGLAKAGLGEALVKLFSNFSKRREEEVAKAWRRVKAERKVQAATGVVGEKEKWQASSGGGTVQGKGVPEAQAVAGDGGQDNDDDDDANVGLPPLGEEEDECHVRTLTEGLTLIITMCSEPIALNAMRTAGASRALIYYLSERHSTVRALTADALSHLGVGDETVVLSLVESMRDDDDVRVRSCAGRALGRIYANRSQSFRSSCSQADSQQVGLSQQGEADWPKMIELASKGIGSRKEQVRRACVGGVAAMGAAGSGCGKVVESVMKYLTSSSNSVRLSAASALLEIGNVGGFVQAAMVRFLNARIEPPQGRRMLTGQGREMDEESVAQVESVRLACYVLGHVGDIRDEESLIVLRKLLPRPDLSRSHGEAQLAPHSTALSSGVQTPCTRRPSWMVNCSFEALVRISHIDWRDRGDTATIVAVRRLNQAKEDAIRRSVCEALGELASPGDRTSFEILTDLNYDPSEDVVEAAMVAVAKLVTGSSDSQGMSVKLASIVRPEAKSRRLVSAARQMREPPKRLVITREMMDKEADIDGDGWHSYIYWSHCFRAAGEAPLRHATTLHEAVCRSGIPGFIYTRETLEQDLIDRREKERADLRKRKTNAFNSWWDKEHGELIVQKENTLARKRLSCDKDRRALEMERPRFDFGTEGSDDDDDIDDDDDGGDLPKDRDRKVKILTVKEKQERRQKREEDKTKDRLEVMTMFDLKLAELDMEHENTMNELTRDWENKINRIQGAARESHEEALDAALKEQLAMHEERQEQAERLWYGDLVWPVLEERIVEAEIFVALFSGHYLEDEVCKREVMTAYRLGKKIVPVVIDAMPGMYRCPAPGVPLSGGDTWWPPRDEIGNIFPDETPFNIFLSAGPIITESGVWFQLWDRIQKLFNEEMEAKQAVQDAKWQRGKELSIFLHGVSKEQRLKSKAFWMAQGMNG